MKDQFPVDSRMRWYKEAVASDAAEHAKEWAQKNQQELLDMAALCSSWSSTEVMEMDRIARRESKSPVISALFKRAASDGVLGDYRKGFSEDLKFLWRDVFSDEALWIALCMVKVREEESEQPEFREDDSWDLEDATVRFI